MNTSSLVCSVVLNFTNGQIIMLSDHTDTCNADPKCGRTSKGCTDLPGKGGRGREDGLAGVA